MKVAGKLHRWDLTPKEAMQLQSRLASSLELVPLKIKPRFVAGADISYEKGDDHLYAAVVVIDIETMRTVEVQVAEGEVHFPYIPGLLSFRESPVLIRALEKVQSPVDLLVCDGQGIAH
ncbi:MAG TPA: endonuclease V, partial [Proteobacteria bacterium]|nr:endonuclease V [Pseudomonadota bacterium]